MFTRDMFNPEGFKNTVVDGKPSVFNLILSCSIIVELLLSIIRNIEVWVDGQALIEKTSVSLFEEKVLPWTK